MTRAMRVPLKLGAVVIAGVLISRYIPPSVRAQLQFPRGMLLAVALLCLFSVYWSIAAKDSAPTKTSESSGRAGCICFWSTEVCCCSFFPFQG